MSVGPASARIVGIRRKPHVFGIHRECHANALLVHMNIIN